MSKNRTSILSKLFAKNTISKYLSVVLVVGVFATLGTYLLSNSKAAAGSDLIVTNVAMNPTAPTVSQAVTFTATIKNNGTGAVNSGLVIGVAFSVDGQKVTWSNTYASGLAPGASTTLSANAGTTGATWTATTGPHTITATVDDTNIISDESNEANNALSISYTVGNTGQLYLSPSNANVLINNNVNYDLRLIPGVNVDGVEATITYDATKLQFVSLDATGSPFDVALGSQSGSNGTITIARGNLTGGVSTDALVTKIVLKALTGSGSTTLQVSGNATKNGVYTNPTLSNATVVLQTPDTTAPTVSLTSPINNEVVWVTKQLSANASDNVGVTKVEFYVDGILKTTDTTAPYSYNLDTTTLANGAHSTYIKAYDAANNVGTSLTVNFTIKNWPEDINQDGIVNLLDFSMLAAKYGQTGTSLGREDINRDGKVNLLDFSLLAAKYGQ